MELFDFTGDGLLVFYVCASGRVYSHDYITVSLRGIKNLSKFEYINIYLKLF